LSGENNTGRGKKMSYHGRIVFPWDG